MKRYSVCFHSFSTGTGLVAEECDTPVQALTRARALSAQLRDVRISDNEAKNVYDLKTFAQMHRLQ